MTDLLTLFAPTILPTVGRPVTTITCLVPARPQPLLDDTTRQMPAIVFTSVPVPPVVEPVREDEAVEVVRPVAQPAPPVACGRHRRPAAVSASTDTAALPPFITVGVVIAATVAVVVVLAMVGVALFGPGGVA